MPGQWGCYRIASLPVHMHEMPAFWSGLRVWERDPAFECGDECILRAVQAKQPRCMYSSLLRVATMQDRRHNACFSGSSMHVQYCGRVAGNAFLHVSDILGKSNVDPMSLR